MGIQERKRASLIRRTIKPDRIYELHFAELSDTEWAATVTNKDGRDRRFRYTHGKLIDEATIGDARVFA